MNLARLVRTVRPLRREQVLGQIAVRLRARSDDASRVLTRFPIDAEQPVVRWNPRTQTPHPDGQANPAESIKAGVYHFVGQARRLGYPPRWDDGSAARLWRYNLHYHAFLFDLSYDDAKTLVVSYLAEAPPSRHAEGWEPYPLSLRICNWATLFFERYRTETLADSAFAARLWLELRRMAYWLSQHIETHIGANHLFENVVALSLFGACFDGELAARCQRLSRRLLPEVIRDQILDDGAHYERSPMYQQRVLFGLLSLINTGDEVLVRTCRAPAERMAGWLSKMTHADGQIALFNDSAIGVYPPTRVLLAWLLDLGLAPRHVFRHGTTWAALSDSGYYVGWNANGDGFVFDAGEIGPAHQPGHAHADFLSVEISYRGRRFVTDAGNYHYESDERRRWARSVESHSTVLIPGHEPVELWGCFRVGRRGVPVDVAYRHEDGQFSIQAGHTGYRHLVGKPTPRRVVTWYESGILILEDRIEAERPVVGRTQLLIDGRWKIVDAGSRRVVFVCENTTIVVASTNDIDITPSQTYPRFGVERPAHLLRQTCRSAARAGAGWTICPAEQEPTARALSERPSLEKNV